jgi:hypothetical protein
MVDVFNNLITKEFIIMMKDHKNDIVIRLCNNNNICLYIHDLNYDLDKIKLGVDIIDNLYSKTKTK